MAPRRSTTRCAAAVHRRTSLSATARTGTWDFAIRPERAIMAGLRRRVDRFRCRTERLFSLGGDNMKKFVYRMLAAASLALAFPCAAEVAVVGCLFDSTNPQITDDPNQCPAERKLDIVSLNTSCTHTSPLAGGSRASAHVHV